MSYAIIRNEKYLKGNLAGIYRHNERKNTNYSNTDIDKSKSKYNYSLKQAYSTYEKIFRDIREKYNLKGQIKKTSKIVCEYIITGSPEFFEEIGEEETKRYFETAYKFVAEYKNLGEQYIISARVHLDERTPHLHIDFIPVVHTLDKKSGKSVDKISCSEFWKEKGSYGKLQDNFYNYVTEAGFDLERGQKHKVEHLSTEKLKQITNYDNIKYEEEQEKNNLPQIIETKDKALILAQNQELIVYTKKLKKELNRAYIAIQNNERLQKENTNLRHENTTLRRENAKLKKYIESSYEVVKSLFNFPINRFKKIVNDFIRNFER